MDKESLRSNLKGIWNDIRKWYKQLSFWPKTLINVVIIVLCIYWSLVICDVQEWWHWDEWMEHIKTYHM